MLSLDDRVARIHEIAGLIDGELAVPARWSGPSRKEFRHRKAFPQQRARVEAVHNWLADRCATGNPPALNADLLLEINRRIGGDGRMRTVSVHVGRFPRMAPHPDVPDLTQVALARANDGLEDPVLASVRLHIELMLIHPFRDGNGRTVRFAASLVLMRSGMKSTLLTAVEQHSQFDPELYIATYNRIQASKPTDHDTWMADNLGLMERNAQWAAMFVERERRLRLSLLNAGVDRRRHDRILLELDHPSRRPSRRARRLFPGEATLRDILADLDERRRAVAETQISRIIDERADNGRR